jgi:hypothetical protein
MKENSVAGSFFKMFWHGWFQTTLPGGITVVRRIETEEICSFQLTKKDQYWIPSTDFPDVDAAIITNDTLYALQYTVRGNHDLNETSIQSFVTKVLKNNSFEGVQYVKILYVVPLGSSGLTVSLEEEFNLTKASGKEKRTNKRKEGQSTPSTLPPNWLWVNSGMTKIRIELGRDCCP